MTDQHCPVRQAAAALSIAPLNDHNCPVCQALALLFAFPLPRSVRAGHGFLSVHCPECGAFLIKEGFLAQGWSTITPEDKQAIARYLGATKDRPGRVREISAETWERWAQLGKLLGNQRRHRRKRKGKRMSTRAYQRSRRLWSSRAWTN
jgi:hypothetical protein